MSEQSIRILLVDDHTLFRSGIKALLARQAGFDVVGEAADGAEGVKLAKQLDPDVVLLDLNMPGISGVEALTLMLQDQAKRAVVMLTVSEEADDLTAALKAGARGYLLKNIDADFLTQAVARAAAGESVMSDSMTAKLMAQFRHGAAAPQAEPAEQELDRLTPREREILGFLAQGKSNKEIARSLDLAESTVKIHVQNILKKLSLSSRVQAAVFAVENGVGRSA
ncbi:MULTISPECIES: response regulator [Chromobacterium]|uniref:response regulator n=1 Tax=Chromobacterium TaxID=535 RepID=UPI000D315D4A|nr:MULTISPECIES: response regulator [Chromobacterium]MBN3003542.1 response regulator [Chromobacterium alkanivorans]MCS3804302.1 two-component system nitrate/nitrite response regulator NarL [Chromobacterium alkanivorans]MCS3818478.1 two-component system nitrate/nitrite response regulator NarL [Chromobacterium alkanivorans]MCS3873587.1 two-component system nitrate/nitrite response regulator NarL [Chromobacterium alkanivorans]MDH0340815.1 response regulator [Chromobacterium haemolyticum]